MPNELSKRNESDGWHECWLCGTTRPAKDLEAIKETKGPKFKCTDVVWCHERDQRRITGAPEIDP